MAVDLCNLVLITRPADEAGLYAAELLENDYHSHVAPMLDIRPVPFDMPDLAGFDGVLATSGRVFGLLADVVISRKISVFTVGSATATAARAAGFPDVSEAQGTGAALAAQLLKTSEASRKYLHIRGRDVAFDLAAALAPAGHIVEPLVVYEAVPVARFNDQTVQLLTDGRIKAVTFFSKRTADAFLALVYKEKLEAALRPIKALCISQSVLECVRPVPWLGVYVSETPDRAGMLNLLKEEFRREQD